MEDNRLMFEGATKVFDAKFLHEVASSAKFKKKKKILGINSLMLLSGRKKLGDNIFHFDEEIEGVHFVEDRRIVKKILEELGYKVSYVRVSDLDSLLAVVLISTMSI